MSLVVQWLRLCAPDAKGQGSVSVQGTRSHMPQIRVCILKLKILCATTKTQCSQINKYSKIIYKLSKESYNVPVITIVQSKKLQLEQGRLLVQT